MKPEEAVYKWIDDKVKEGKTIVIAPENNGSVVGVWIGVPGKTKPALGYGSNAVEAILHAMSWEEVDRVLGK
jgi:hypothetical protein